MGRKNHLQKHRSRKYRKFKSLEPVNQEIGLSLADSLTAKETQDDSKIKETMKPEIINSAISQNSQEKFESKPKMTNLNFKDSVKDLQNALYLSAAFVILLIIAYIVKIKTPIFSIGVDHLYQIFHF